MEQLKLIWDFKGPHSKQTAEHHLIHLKEFIAARKENITITGVETISEFHSIAYLVVNRSDMPPIRDVLKPHRGQLYTSS